MTQQRGFTLVEVLVTMAIFALIGLASFTVLDQMTKTEKQSKQARQQLQQLQFSWLLLEQDLRQAVAKPNRPEGREVIERYISNDERVISSDSGALALIKTGYDNPGLMLPRAELQPVFYRVQEGVLQRITYPYVNDRQGERVVQDLLSGVTDFSIRFYRQSQQAKANQGVDAGWRASWNTSGDMPRAVEVTLDTEAYGVMQRRFLTASMANQQQSSGDLQRVPGDE